jgi:hypothetical protein
MRVRRSGRRDEKSLEREQGFEDMGGEIQSSTRTDAKRLEDGSKGQEHGSKDAGGGGRREELVFEEVGGRIRRCKCRI